MDSVKKATFDYSHPSFWETRYNESAANFEWYCTPERLESHLEQFLPQNRNSKILIIGNGTSSLPFALWNNGYRNITVVDFASVLISDLTKQFAHSHPSLELVCADIRRMACFGSNTFDAIIDKACIDCTYCDTEIWSSVGAAMNECSRILRPGAAMMSISHSDRNARQTVEDVGLWTNISQVKIARPKIFDVDYFRDEAHFIHTYEKGGVVGTFTNIKGPISSNIRQDALEQDVVEALQDLEKM